jgi:hypothetical protein
MTAKWRRRGVARVAGVVAGAAAGAATWPAARLAWANDEWCDTDPVLVIRTPAGNPVSVYYLTGVYGELNVVAGLLGNLTASYTATPSGLGTAVTVRVTVPAGSGGASYPTRVKVSSGPLGTLTVYGQTTGTSGAPMEVPFYLAVP